MEQTKLSKAVQEQFNQAVEKSSEVADALLMENGWEILNELHKATYATVVSTSIVMIPAMQNKEIILEKISDPTGFNKSLETASGEISKMIQGVQLLHKGHYDKTGNPTIDDIDLINDLTLGYSQIQTCMETAVQPLLMALIDQMQEAGIDTEKVFLNTETEEESLNAGV